MRQLECHLRVVDDSLVRGTSSRAIIKALRRGGARKISLVITYPPIKFPCFAGIDFPSQEELATYTAKKIFQWVRGFAEIWLKKIAAL